MGVLRRLHLSLSLNLLLAANLANLANLAQAVLLPVRLGRLGRLVVPMPNRVIFLV
jgi:hypothetical protein